jgi:hypothetical protein
MKRANAAAAVSHACDDVRLIDLSVGLWASAVRAGHLVDGQPAAALGLPQGGSNRDATGRGVA